MTNLLATILQPSPAANLLLGLQPPPPILSQWMHVERRFSRFLTNIEPTALQHEDVWTKAQGIATCLNRHYWHRWPLSQNDVTAVLAGSWAKGTRARPSSDLDMIFLLPWPEFPRFERRVGNRQSAILQEMKQVLAVTYPLTDIRGDGPTVIMNFSSYKIEIAPAFRVPSAPAYIDDPGFQVWLCDTNQGGRYKLAAPAAERGKLWQLDMATGGNLLALIRMAKTWKRHCNVPIKSFYLEQMAMEFLAQWDSTRKGPYWFDWMMRDFFAFMLTRRHGSGALPVSGELFFYGDLWASRAETARCNAIRACDYEQRSLNGAAGAEWQKVFGTFIPSEAS